jgi:Thiamine pyrophosphate enzyme, N-terminal TPP binding domain
MSKRVADLLVDKLRAAGVHTCDGVVGDTLNRIAHAIDRSPIDWVHMRHEEAGAFAAAAEALLGDPLLQSSVEEGRRVQGGELRLLATSPGWAGSASRRPSRYAIVAPQSRERSVP